MLGYLKYASDLKVMMRIFAELKVVISYGISPRKKKKTYLCHWTNLNSNSYVVQRLVFEGSLVQTYWLHKSLHFLLEKKEAHVNGHLEIILQKKNEFLHPLVCTQEMKGKQLNLNFETASKCNFCS